MDATNVLFNRDSLMAVDYGRSPFPFEAEIKNVPYLDQLTKTITVFNTVPKVDANGNQLFLLPQDPIEVPVTNQVQVKNTTVSQTPSMINVKKPLLGPDGKQVQYEIMQTVVTPATYDQDGNVLTPETTSQVGTGQYQLCYITEQEQEKDAAGNLLYWNTEEVQSTVLQPQPDKEITADDPAYVEGLEQATEQKETSQVVPFLGNMQDFTYEDIRKQKESYLNAGTFFDHAILFENPQNALGASARNVVDIGSGFISFPASGTATFQFTLPSAASLVGLKWETSADGLVVQAGTDGKTFAALDSNNEATFSSSVSTVYVNITNPTTNRIDLYSLGILV